MEHRLKSPPVVLAIGGSDCSAGAGIQADLKAIQASGGYGLTVVTGVVAESPHEVVSWTAVSSQLLRDQLECVFCAYPISVVKIGLLFNSDLVQVVASVLKEFPHLSVVIDPVGSASAGAEFGGASLRDSLKEHLVPLSSLVTPNIPEAQLFLPQDSELEDSSELAETLGKELMVPVLVKGGHRSGDNAVDVLWSSSKALESYSLPWIKGGGYHGTGCTLSSAIATQLAKGESLGAAVKKGKAYLYDCILNGHEWNSHGRNTCALK